MHQQLHWFPLIHRYAQGVTTALLVQNMPSSLNVQEEHTVMLQGYRMLINVYRALESTIVIRRDSLGTPNFVVQVAFVLCIASYLHLITIF